MKMRVTRRMRLTSRAKMMRMRRTMREVMRKEEKHVPW
jgi:hypothetical protein